RPLACEASALPLSYAPQGTPDSNVGWQVSIPSGDMARTLVTGGAGYIGMMLADELLDAGREVTALDVFLHGQREQARMLHKRGVRVVEGDIRDAEARRAALGGADSVVHLAAIVGDPACARDPELAQAVNVDASKALAADAADAEVERFVMAS